MHDNDPPPAKLSRTERRAWSRIKKDLRDIPDPRDAEDRAWSSTIEGLRDIPDPRDNRLVRFMRHRPMYGMLLTTTVACSAVASVALLAGIGEGSGYPVAQETVLQDPARLSRLGLCASVLRDAATDYEADHAVAKARELRRAAYAAESAHVACLATATFVTVKFAEQVSVVNAADLVGDQHLPPLDPAAAASNTD